MSPFQFSYHELNTPICSSLSLKIERNSFHKFYPYSTFYPKVDSVGGEGHFRHLNLAECHRIGPSWLGLGPTRNANKWLYGYIYIYWICMWCIGLYNNYMNRYMVFKYEFYVNFFLSIIVGRMIVFYDPMQMYQGGSDVLITWPQSWVHAYVAFNKS